jgi:hypothetical protein
MNAPSKVRFRHINVFRSIARVALNAAFEEIPADDFTPLAYRLLPQDGHAGEYGGQILNDVTGIVGDETRINSVQQSITVDSATENRTSCEMDRP